MPDDRTPSRLECLGGVIVSPIKTFEHLASNPQWLLPLIVLTLYVLVVFVAKMTAMSVFTMLSVGREIELPGKSVFMLAAMVVSQGMIFVMGVVAAVVVLGAMTGALYAILRAFRTKPRFYALLSAIAYAEFVPRLIGASVKELVPLFTGKLTLWGEDIPTGIAPIFSEFDTPVLIQTLLGRIEIFHLWSFALVAIAVRFVGKVASEKAVPLTALYWGVCILAIAGIRFLFGFLAGLG